MRWYSSFGMLPSRARRSSPRARVMRSLIRRPHFNVSTSQARIAELQCHTASRGYQEARSNHRNERSVTALGCPRSRPTLAPEGSQLLPATPEPHKRCPATEG